MNTLHSTARRAGALVAGVAAAALLLTGCGTGSSPESSASSSAAASDLLPAAEGKTQYPLTLETPWGETVLEERPERVAALAIDAVDTELLLALGVTPVTTSEAALSNAPWSVDAGADRIETTFEPNYDDRVPEETIAAAEPDLLVALTWDLADDYSKLSMIAPVLGTPEKVDDYWGTPWQDHLRWLGEALDLQDRAEQVIADYDDRLAKIKDEHPEFADRTAVFAVWQGTEYGLSLYSVSGSAVDTMFTSIGLDRNPLDGYDAGTTIPAENYAQLDSADVLLIGSASDADLDTLLEAPLFAFLSVVKDERLIVLSEEEYGFPLIWALGAGKVLAQEWILDQIVPMLSEQLG